MAFQPADDDSTHHPMFVPSVTWPDVSKSPGTAQPDGAAQGVPQMDDAGGNRIVTIDHTSATGGS